METRDPSHGDRQTQRCSIVDLRFVSTSMPQTGHSRLQRERHRIPRFVMDALVKAKARDAYLARPAYQQNDYIGWIKQAKLETTKQKRLQQMIDELKGGRLYMKMAYRPGESRSNDCEAVRDTRRRARRTRDRPAAPPEL